MKIKNTLNSKKLTPYLFLAPFFIIFSIFMLYPILNSLFLSFTSEQGFIGLGNFKRVLSDKIFWKSIMNVFLILAVQIPIMLFLKTVNLVVVARQRA